MSYSAEGTKTKSTNELTETLSGLIGQMNQVAITMSNVASSMTTLVAKVEANQKTKKEQLRDMVEEVVDERTKQNQVNENNKSQNFHSESKPSSSHLTSCKSKEQMTQVQINHTACSNKINNETNKPIRLEIVNRESSGTKRDYKLTSTTRFEFFYDLLSSELRTNDLLYVIESNLTPNDINKQTRTKHRHRVRDIIINHIDETYHLKILNISDPREIILKLRELRRYESNSNSVIVLRQLYSIQYLPAREKATDFLEKFEDVIRSHENLSTGARLSDEEKRDAFFNAISTTVPEAVTADFVSQRSGGKGLTYDDLKSFILQAEAARAQAVVGDNRAVLQVRRNPKDRCRECDDYGHDSSNCPRRGQGLKKCYECNQFGTHVAAQCPQRLERMRRPNDRYVPFNKNFLKSDKRGGKFSRNRNQGIKRKSNDNDRNDNVKKFKGTPGKTKPKLRIKTHKEKNNPNGGNFSNGKPNKGEHITCNVLNIVKTNKSSNERLIDENLKLTKNLTLTKFIADSGASEHLSNSRLIFKSLDTSKIGTIKCANKESSADLKTEGVGTIEMILNNDRSIKLNDVIYANDLAENLLSLRKFADLGLAIYMDDKSIDIFDPESNETLMTGIYDRPYWSIEFLTRDNLNYESNAKQTKKRILVNLTGTQNEGKSQHRYFTRSVTTRPDTDMNSDTGQDVREPKKTVVIRNEEEMNNLNDERLKTNDITNDTNDITNENLNEILENEELKTKSIHEY